SLNPHAGEHGLFGDEEGRIIEPAVAAEHAAGIDVRGPWPADTLVRSAIVDARYDGLVAMYHEQGHIPFKLIGFDRAVNVTLGLPIVRTSPSHGTAFDIAWQGIARPEGMCGAMLTAARLVHSVDACKHR
ncbi:MAG: 4-hydroxythreonine-4-phosphate dehydrogenase PdxA, partial [Planctomycetaceae bacterium]|nr:4-hydroxythreonine-4-phosphate dehydrogenase PdxA [Planctomycetaceae bacterium]